MVICIAIDILGNYIEAIGYYDKALEHNPTDVEVLNNKGLALLNLGRYDEAIQYYDKVLEIQPNYVDVLYNKGLTLGNLLVDTKKKYNIMIKC